MQWLILFLLLPVVCFPTIIFLDYHSRHNIWRAFLYLSLFMIALVLLKELINQLGLGLTYYLWLIPVLIFLMVFLSAKRK